MAIGITVLFLAWVGVMYWKWGVITHDVLEHNSPTSNTSNVSNVWNVSNVPFEIPISTL